MGTNKSLHFLRFKEALQKTIGHRESFASPKNSTKNRCRTPEIVKMRNNSGFSQSIMDLKSLIRDVPDFPKPGILFRDITTLLNHPEGMRYTMDALTQICIEANLKPDHVVGMESRGFIFGPTLAYNLNAGFVPVRKPGKLPAAVHTVEYELEYGTDTLEIHQDAVGAGDKVLIVDDLIATGGTAKATAELLAKIGCEIVGFVFIIELLDLKGRDRLPDVPFLSLLQY